MHYFRESILFFIFVLMNTLLRYAGILIFTIMGIFSTLNSTGQETPCNREAVAAGRFYSENPTELKNDLRACFENAHIETDSTLQAVIVPHAGYVFSGETAAKAFAKTDITKPYKRIFLIASSHYTSHHGASIYSKGNYETPLGIVETDIEVIEELLQNEQFTHIPGAHDREHSLEVQIPFLQYLYDRNVPPIVPIVITTQSADECIKLAKALKPWFNEDNLFVISSDFSHYPQWDDANRVDYETAQSILCNDPATFLQTLQRHAGENVQGLATSACGWTSILTLMHLTAGKSDIKYSHIAYTNSGDHPRYGDKTGVVGYHAIALTREEKPAFSLSEKDEKQLLGFAREVIEDAMTFREEKYPGFTSDALNEHCGAFVTLRNKGELRGCIGRFGDRQPLWQVVEDMAVSAALHDHRFKPVTLEEMEEIHIEISILTPMQKIDTYEDIIPGKHGIYLKKGINSGTFLPQVAIDTGWDLEELLGHLSRDKAGLGWDGWRDKDVELYIYEAIIIEE